MWCNVEYAGVEDIQLLQAILLYGKPGTRYSRQIQIATVHEPVRDRPDEAPRLSTGTPLDRDFLLSLIRDLGGHQSSVFLPEDVFVSSPTTLAWWQPAAVRTMFFEQTKDGKIFDGKPFPHPPLVFAVRNESLQVWAMVENRRPTPNTLLYHAPYWNTGPDGSVCHGSMPTPRAATPQNFRQWSEAFFTSRFSHPNFGEKKIKHPEGLLGLWRDITGTPAFPFDLLVPYRPIREVLCRE